MSDEIGEDIKALLAEDDGIGEDIKALLGEDSAPSRPRPDPIDDTPASMRDLEALGSQASLFAREKGGDPTFPSSSQFFTERGGEEFVQIGGRQMPVGESGGLDEDSFRSAMLENLKLRGFDIKTKDDVKTASNALAVSRARHRLDLERANALDRMGVLDKLQSKDPSQVKHAFDVIGMAGDPRVTLLDPSDPTKGFFKKIEDPDEAREFLKNSDKRRAVNRAETNDLILDAVPGGSLGLLVSRAADSLTLSAFSGSKTDDAIALASQAMKDKHGFVGTLALTGADLAGFIPSVGFMASKLGKTLGNIAKAGGAATVGAGQTAFIKSAANIIAGASHAVPQAIQDQNPWGPAHAAAFFAIQPALRVKVAERFSRLNPRVGNAIGDAVTFPLLSRSLNMGEGTLEDDAASAIVGLILGAKNGTPTRKAFDLWARKAGIDNVKAARESVLREAAGVLRQRVGDLELSKPAVQKALGFNSKGGITTSGTRLGEEVLRQINAAEKPELGKTIPRLPAATTPAGVSGRRNRPIRVGEGLQTKAERTEIKRLNKKKGAELKKEALELGIDTSGGRKEVIARIAKHKHRADVESVANPVDDIVREPQQGQRFQESFDPLRDPVRGTGDVGKALMRAFGGLGEREPNALPIPRGGREEPGAPRGRGGSRGPDQVKRDLEARGDPVTGREPQPIPNRPGERVDIREGAPARNFGGENVRLESDAQFQARVKADRAHRDYRLAWEVGLAERKEGESQASWDKRLVDSHQRIQDAKEARREALREYHKTLDVADPESNVRDRRAKSVEEATTPEDRSLEINDPRNKPGKQRGSFNLGDIIGLPVSAGKLVGNGIRRTWGSMIGRTYSLGGKTAIEMGLRAERASADAWVFRGLMAEAWENAALASQIGTPLSGGKGQIGGGRISHIERPIPANRNDTAAFAEIHEMIEGRAAPRNANQARVIDTLQALIHRRGEIFESVDMYRVGENGPEKFKSVRRKDGSTAAPQILTLEGIGIIEKGGPLFDSLVRGIASKNNMTPKEVRDALLKMRSQLSETNADNPERAAHAEFFRRFRMPTHIRTDASSTNWVPVLEVNPYKYATRLMEMGAARAAFIKNFGQEARGDSKVDMLMRRMNEAHGKRGTVYGKQLMRALHQMPIQEMLLDPEIATSASMRGIQNILSLGKASLLSASAVVNLPEVFGNVREFAGNRAFASQGYRLWASKAKAMAKGTRGLGFTNELLHHLELAGITSRDILDTSYDPNRKVTSFTKAVRNMSGRVFVHRFINESQEQHGALVAQYAAEKMQANSGLSKPKNVAFWVARMRPLGYGRRKAERLARGMGSKEEYIEMSRRAAAKMTGSTLTNAEKSRWELGRIVGRGIPFQGYWATVVRDSMSKVGVAAKSWREIATRKDLTRGEKWNRALRSTTLLGNHVTGKTIQGAGAYLAMSWILSVENDRFEEAINEIGHDPLAFLGKSLGSSFTSGPVGALMRSVGDGELTDLFFPAYAAREAWEAASGSGRYSNMDGWERSRQFLGRFTPVTRMIRANYAATLGDKTDKEVVQMLNAKSAFYRIADPERIKFHNARESEFHKKLKKASLMAKRGEDPAAIEELLSEAIGLHPEGKKKGRSGRRKSFLARRLLKPSSSISQEQIDRAMDQMTPLHRKLITQWDDIMKNLSRGKGASVGR